MAHPRSLVLVLVACVVFVSRRDASGALDTTLKNRICSGLVYIRHWAPFVQLGDYECVVNRVIQLIMDATYQSPSYSNYTSGHCQWDSMVAYGYGSCRKELLPSECSDCIKTAKDRLFEECTHSVGAQVELQDCEMRYENYPFMGPV